MSVTALSRLSAWRDRLPPWLALAVALALYLLALNVLRDQVPPGLNNDAAEEALRGVHLLESGRFEVMSLQGVTSAGTSYGVSMETLFLYILGVAARLMGATPLAIHVSTWIFVLTSIWLICLLTRRVEPALPSWLPVLLATSSVWLFHYARSGLRANTAPVFLLAFTLLLDRTEQALPRWGIALAAGGTLGLSLYGYTSCRILPIAFMIHALGRLWRDDEKRADRLRRYAAVLTGALLVSIPNLVFLLHRPDVFLFRGAYVVQGDKMVKALNVLRTLLLPIHYPDYQMPLGPTHKFDGVSIGLTAAGLRPVLPIVGVAFLLGLARAWRRRREPTISFLLIVWLTGTVALGIAGPSLTRMVVLLPVYLVIAAMGFGAVFKYRGAPFVIGTAILLLTASQARGYFVTLPRNAVCRLQYRPAATAVGLRARALAAQGTRVMCVVAGNANVVEYLTHALHERVRVIEFFFRPANKGEIPLLQFQPQVILMERDPEFDSLRAYFATMGGLEPSAGFDEFMVDPVLIWRKATQTGVSLAPDSALSMVGFAQGTALPQGHSAELDAEWSDPSPPLVGSQQVSKGQGPASTVQIGRLPMMAGSSR